MTSAWIFDQVHAHLVFLQDSNCEIFSPNEWAAPAASIQSFMYGAIGTQLPSHSRWIEAYGNDPAYVAIQAIVLDPSSICKESLKSVHYAYRHHLWQSHIIIEDEMLMLILQEPIWGSTSYVHLQIVPDKLCNILFITFHSNPIVWSPECVAYPPSSPPAIPLAWNVLLHQTNVSGMPRVHPL